MTILFLPLQKRYRGLGLSDHEVCNVQIFMKRERLLSGGLMDTRIASSAKLEKNELIERCTDRGIRQYRAALAAKGTLTLRRRLSTPA